MQIKPAFFIAPVASRIHLKRPTPTGFFTPAASRSRLMIGYGRVSTTEQNLGLEHGVRKPVFDASVDPTRSAQSRCPWPGRLGVPPRREWRGDIETLQRSRPSPRPGACLVQHLTPRRSSGLPFRTGSRSRSGAGFRPVAASRARRESSRYRSLTSHRDLSTMTSVRIPCVLKVGSWGQLGVS